MTCQSCGGWGISLIVYEDTSEVYAVCLCPIGEQWRSTHTFVNHSGDVGKSERTDPLWHIWAHQHGITVERMKLIEDAVTPEELARRGFRELSAPDAMSAISAAARSRKVGR
jgi:hypothetical protein